MAKILRRDANQSTPPPSVLTAEFLKFFSEKVESVRSATGGHRPPEILFAAVASLSNFRACTEDEARAIIMRLPSKSCSLDPIPTTILKECIDDLLPFLTEMCNASLLEGHLPVSQRHAIITPLIKESNLDATDVKNYRPVSNLTFDSKVVERLVSKRLVGFPTGKQLDASRTVGVSKASFDRDCVASGHLGPSQLYGQARGNAARFARSQCRVRLSRSWYPVGTAGAHIRHHWISTQLDKILPLGPDEASDIPKTTVRRHEVDLQCPSRFRGWTISIPYVHGRIARYHQEGGHEGSLVCRWYTSPSQHWNLECAESCPTVCQLHRENWIMD